MSRNMTTLKLVEAKAERELSDVAKTAKEIREALKKTFPGVKFSVRSDSYSLGSSVTVKWIDGPTPKQVEKIACSHEQIDRDERSGEILSGGNRFVHCTRELSQRVRDFAQKEACRRFGEPPPGFVHEFQWRVACATEVRPDGQIVAWHF